MNDTLTKLFRQLYFPMGGYEEETDTMWMSEGRGVKLVATRTENGIVCISGKGEVITVNSEGELEQIFLSYFKGNGLQRIVGAQAHQ
jgi:hypothetical protein